MKMVRVVVLLSVLVQLATSQCPSGCDCSSPGLSCTVDSLVSAGAVSISSAVISNVVFIPHDSIQIDPSVSNVTMLSISQNAMLQNISLNFHQSILSVDMMVITHNPRLERAVYNAGENQTSFLTINASSLSISNNSALVYVDIRNWVMPMVTMIDLSNNSLRHIPSGTFQNKSLMLIHVKLNNNQLFSLYFCTVFDLFHRSSMVSLQNLTLDIQYNQISCNCYHYYLRRLGKPPSSLSKTNRYVNINDTYGLNCLRQNGTLLNFYNAECNQPHQLYGCADRCPKKCDCLEQMTGELCSLPSTCDARHCDGLETCVRNPSNGKLTCIEDPLYVKLKYGDRKIERCNPDTHKCRELKNAACDPHTNFCGCINRTVAHKSECIEIWAPCEAEMLCKRLDMHSLCDGKPLHELGDKLYFNGGPNSAQLTPLRSESDCLCYLYAQTESAKNDCISYRVLELGISSNYTAPRSFGEFDDIFVLPIIIGLLSLGSSVGVYILRRMSKRRKEKLKQDRIARREERKQKLADKRQLIVPPPADGGGAKRPKKQDSFKSVLSKKSKQPKLLINKTQVDEKKQRFDPIPEM